MAPASLIFMHAVLMLNVYSIHSTNVSTLLERIAFLEHELSESIPRTAIGQSLNVMDAELIIVSDIKDSLPRHQWIVGEYNRYYTPRIPCIGDLALNFPDGHYAVFKMKNRRKFIHLSNPEGCDYVIWDFINFNYPIDYHPQRRWYKCHYIRKLRHHPRDSYDGFSVRSSKYELPQLYSYCYLGDTYEACMLKLHVNFKNGRQLNNVQLPKDAKNAHDHTTFAGNQSELNDLSDDIVSENLLPWLDDYHKMMLSMVDGKRNRLVHAYWDQQIQQLIHLIRIDSLTASNDTSVIQSINDILNTQGTRFKLKIATNPRLIKDILFPAFHSGSATNITFSISDAFITHDAIQVLSALIYELGTNAFNVDELLAIQFYESLTRLITMDLKKKTFRVSDRCISDPWILAVATKLIADAIDPTNAFDNITLDSIIGMYSSPVIEEIDQKMVLSLIEQIDREIFETFVRTMMLVDEVGYIGLENRSSQLYIVLQAMDVYWNYNFQPLQEQMLINNASFLGIRELQNARRKSWQSLSEELYCCLKRFPMFARKDEEQMSLLYNEWKTNNLADEDSEERKNNTITNISEAETTIDTCECIIL
eukprot:802590_1